MQVSTDTAEEEPQEARATSIFSRPSKTQIKITQDSSVTGDHQIARSTQFRSWADESFQISKHRPGLLHQNSSVQDDVSFSPELEREESSLAPTRSDRPFYARSEQRTFMLKGLSEKTTHKDIIGFLRGGTILDVFLRPNERNASVSFVEGSSAQQFMNYARRNDIYVHGKRVRWSFAMQYMVLANALIRLRSTGMIDNSFYRVTWQTR